jgi:hypothetical protein
MADWNDRIKKFASNEANKTTFAGVSNAKAKLLLLNEVWEISLEDALDSFFMMPSIIELGNQKVKELKRNGSAKKDVYIQRYRVLIGKNIHFNTRTLPKFNPRTKNDTTAVKYSDAMISFFKSTFTRSPDLDKSIKHAIEDLDTINILIIARQQEEMKSQRGHFNYTDHIIAAANIMLSMNNNPGCLLYLATSRKNRVASFGGKNQDPNVPYITTSNFHKYGLGTFLIATTQALQYIMSNDSHYNIICQVNVNQKLGFYMQLHFKMIPENDSLAEKYKTILGDHFIDDTDLSLFCTRARVNVLHPWVFYDTRNKNAFVDYIIPESITVIFTTVNDYFTLVIRKNLRTQCKHTIIFQMIMM